MIKPSFFPFLIRVVVVFVVAILPAYYFERVRSRYKQTLLNYKEEIGRLYEIIEKEKRTVQRLENENRLLLGLIDQVPIAQCKNHPLLKRLYDKDNVCPIDHNGLIGYLDTIYGCQKKEVDYVEP